MIDDLDAQLVFDIVAVVALVFAAGLIWRLIVAARTPATSSRSSENPQQHHPRRVAAGQVKGGPKVHGVVACDNGRHDRRGCARPGHGQHGDLGHRVDRVRHRRAADPAAMTSIPAAL
jgi:hypothetical protein